MPKFHVNPSSGIVSHCRALKRCRFGADVPHYPTPLEAQAAFERSQVFPPSLKRELTRDQAQALASYQGGMFYDLNYGLRNWAKRNFMPRYYEIVEHLDSIFEEPHEVVPDKVYRLVYAGEDTGYLDRPLIVGEIIEEKGFLSTSESEQFVEDCFDHGLDGEPVNTLLTILPKQEASCIRPSPHTMGHDHEAEVLFGRNHRFEVLEDDQSYSRRYITLRMV